MRYTFLLYSDPEDLAKFSPDDWERATQAFGTYIGELKKASVFVDTDRLQPAQMATTVSLKNGSKTIHDGPFSVTKETLGGYFVVDVPDLDTAIAWAEKCPAAKTGKVEIRPSAFPVQ